MSMRATSHSGRFMSARHNDRNFDTDKADHIDKTRTHDNVYVCVYKDMNFMDAEIEYYKKHFKDMINDINERAERSRHPERKTNAELLLKSKKTMPEEVIYQIGNKDNHIDKDVLRQCFREFGAWHRDKFGEHVKMLNYALHLDEETPHIHARQVWTYKDPKGFIAIGQHKALEQMGYKLPDPDKPRGKNNNLKMVYTAECRQKWLQILKEHNIEIEETPQKRPNNLENLNKGDYIIYAQELKQQELITANNEYQKQLDEQKNKYLQLVTKSIDFEEIDRLANDATVSTITREVQYDALKQLEQQGLLKDTAKMCYTKIKPEKSINNLRVDPDKLLDHIRTEIQRQAAARGNIPERHQNNNPSH